jgi:dTDP-4-amino-4,6-dideoxygalactose transaminase
MKVPFVDLAVRDSGRRAEMLSAISAVLERGDYILGTEVEEFEREFAAYCHAGHAVGVSSGTTALVLGLHALGIGPGDEVITVANSFLSTVSSILLAGARPVLVDVADDENIDVSAVEAAITARTRAVVPVHLRGRPADLSGLVRLARSHGLSVVEDASQAQGAWINGRHAGTFGELGCFSLHPLKNLPALGDAGIMLTDEADLAERLRALRNHGLADRGYATIVGDNARLDTIQAAVLRLGLRRLGESNERRRAIARSYHDAFAGLPVTLPGSQAGVTHVYHHYVMQVPDRAALLDSMQAAGIDARVHYPVPTHRQPAFEHEVTLGGPLRRTEWQADRIVSLPCFPAMRDDQVHAVISAVVGHYQVARRAEAAGKAVAG